MSLLVVGSVAYDSVETPFGKRERTLGGSATFFSTAASYFTPVRLVAVVGRDFGSEHIEFLKTRGVDVQGLSIQREGDTFFWRGKYNFNLNDCQTLETKLNVFESFRPQIPENYKDSAYVFLANIDPELQLSVLKQVPHPKLTALDTMNFWIANKRPELLTTLAKVDMVLINDAEARALADEYNLVSAAKKILSYGPKYLVVKQGEYGALLFSASEVFRAPAFPLESVFDPTGAGDAFAGGLMGYIAQLGADARHVDFNELKKAVVAGSVVASFAVEQFSIDRFRTLKTEEIAQRFRLFHGLTHFDDVLPTVNRPAGL